MREPARHFTHTPEQLAEIAGAHIGHELLQKLLHTKTQAEAVPLIRDAINDLNHPAAVGGFAAQLADVLLIGLRNLPKIERGTHE